MKLDKSLVRSSVCTYEWKTFCFKSATNLPLLFPGITLVAGFRLISHRKRLVGSMIGGIPETQEMLDYCAENILSDVEVIPIAQINEAYERMLRSEVKYRFVIDMPTL
jgi:D-arabinose 1-dehydrogenase-like Zn-dependent alcohol dehydrogenase